MATAGAHRWQASSHRACKQHPEFCRSELASRWQPPGRIAGKPAPTGPASNTPHSAGASLPRDGKRRVASLASQLPQGLLATHRILQERACLAMATAEAHRWQASSHRGLLATPRILQERACLAMATAGAHRWQASSHKACKQHPAPCRSELASRWQPPGRIAGKPAPTRVC